VFLDEPSAGLDPAARRDVWQIIDDVRARGTTIILTSHLMDEVEHLADEVYIMDSGRILAHGTVADLVSLEAAPAAATTSVKVSGTLGNADFLELQDWAGRRGLTVSRRSLDGHCSDPSPTPRPALAAHLLACRLRVARDAAQR